MRVTKWTASHLIVYIATCYIVLWLPQFIGRSIPHQTMYSYTHEATTHWNNTPTSVIRLEYVDMRIRTHYRAEFISARLSSNILSPNGRYLTSFGVDGVTILDIPTQAQFLLPFFNPLEFRWSPDSRFIVYQHEDELYQVAVMPTGATSAVRVIDNTPNLRIAGIFSQREASTYYLLLRQAGIYTVYHINHNGVILATIPLNFPIVTSWDMNRDMTNFAFVVKDEDHTYLYTLGLTNSMPIFRLLYTYQGRDLSHISWSPDGQYLAFYRRVSRQSDYEVMLTYLNTDETHLLHTFPSPYGDGISSLVWSPDGQYLTFDTYDLNSGTATLYVVAINGQFVHQIPIYPSTHYFWTETEDGNRLVYRAMTTADVYSIQPDGTDRQRYILDHPIGYTVIEQ